MKPIDKTVAFLFSIIWGVIFGFFTFNHLAGTVSDCYYGIATMGTVIIFAPYIFFLGYFHELEHKKKRVGA